MSSENEISEQLRAIMNLIRRDIEKSKDFKDNNLPHRMQGWAVDYFYKNRDKDIFQKDFETRFSIRRSTASKMLSVMETNGLIERKGVEYDKRLKKITLTKKAIDIHTSIKKDIKKREVIIRKGLSEEEIESFLSIIKKIKANLEDKND